MMTALGLMQYDLPVSVCCKIAHKNAHSIEPFFMAITLGTVLVGGNSASAQKQACLLRAGDGGKARAAGYIGGWHQISKNQRHFGPLARFGLAVCLRGRALRIALARCVIMRGSGCRRAGGFRVTYWCPAGRRV